MSFEFDIPEKDIAAVDFMGKNHKALLRAALEARAARGFTQKQVAELLGVNKSVISRALSGRSNLTERTIGELCWALGYEPKLVLTELSKVGANADVHSMHVFKAANRGSDIKLTNSKSSDQSNSFNANLNDKNTHQRLENAS